MGILLDATNTMPLHYQPITCQNQKSEYVPGGMTVAWAGASDYHVIDGVVVLFLNFISRIQEIVTQVVKTGEIES